MFTTASERRRSFFFFNSLTIKGRHDRWVFEIILALSFKRFTNQCTCIFRNAEIDFRQLFYRNVHEHFIVASLKLRERNNFILVT